MHARVCVSPRNVTVVIFFYVVSDSECHTPILIPFSYYCYRTPFPAVIRLSYCFVASSRRMS